MVRKSVLIGILLILALGIAQVAMANSTSVLASAADNGMNLQISKTDLGTGWYRWSFDVTNGFSDKEVVRQFTVGTLYDDYENNIDDYSVTSGVFKNYQTSLKKATPFESTFISGWMGFSLAYGQTATFSFDTSLSSQDLGLYQARGQKKGAEWADLPTPTAPVPEPGSFAVLGVGLTGVLGFLKKRR